MGVKDLEKKKEDLKLKSYFEKFVRDVLVKEEIPAIYEPMPFPVNGEEKNEFYLPDFITSIFVNGKPVVLEPHSFVEIEIAMKEKDEREKKFKLEKAICYIERIGKFRKSYGTYVIIISSMPERIVEEMLGLKIHEFVDEYWFLKHHRNFDEEGHHYKTKKLLNHLKRLKEKGEVKNKDDLLNTLLAKIKEKERVKNEKELLNILNSKFIENVNEVEEKDKSAFKKIRRN